MNTGDALLRACLDAPDDDLPRLVYADWLQENGAPERAEFIRLQLLIAQHEWTGDAPREALIRRNELLSAHEAEWNPLPTSLRDTGRFERGFISQVHVATDEEAATVARYPEVIHVQVGSNCTDAALTYLARLPFLAELALDSPALTGEGMRSLAQHPRLRRIDLGNATITSPWLRYLRDAPRLVRVKGYPYQRDAIPPEWTAWEQARAERFRLLSLEDRQRAARAFLFDERDYRWWKQDGWLNFNQSDITDADLELLAALPGLAQLAVYQTEITHQGLWHFADHTGVRSLSIGSNAIDNLDALARMTQLRELGLIGMGAYRNGAYEWTLTDAATTALATLTGLEELELSVNPITDATLACLTGLTELRKLDLADTRITNAGLHHLRGLKKLEHLNLRNTEVTAKAVKELRTHLPRAKVLWKSR